MIEGPTHFPAPRSMCPPALRPAVVILLAMLAAKGTSVLRSTYVIHRGYEDLAERLNQLGANIETFRDIWNRPKQPQGDPTNQAPSGDPGPPPAPSGGRPGMLSWL